MCTRFAQDRHSVKLRQSHHFSRLLYNPCQHVTATLKASYIARSHKQKEIQNPNKLSQLNNPFIFNNLKVTC